MRVVKSTARNKIRYAGFVGDQRVTHWLATPSDVHRHWEGALLTGEHEESAREVREALERELAEEGFDIEAERTGDLLTDSALLYQRLLDEGADQDTIERAICALVL